MGANLNAVREYNRSLVLNCLRKSGPISRVALAKQIGLSRATVSSIIDELVTKRVVEEGEKLNATERGGRRATYIDTVAQFGEDVQRFHRLLG